MDDMDDLDNSDDTNSGESWSLGPFSPCRPSRPYLALSNVLNAPDELSLEIRSQEIEIAALVGLEDVVGDEPAVATVGVG